MAENIVDEELEVEVISDMNVLKTRATEHKRNLENVEFASRAKKSTRKVNIIKCNEHYKETTKDIWSVENSDCKLCVKFLTLDDLKEGVLPRVLDILNLIFTKKSVSHGQKNTYPLRECAVIISIQWVRCNVYPVSIRTVERCIGDLFDSYRALKKCSNKFESYWSKCNPFLHNLIELFEIGTQSLIMHMAWTS